MPEPAVRTLSFIGHDTEGTAFRDQIAETARVAAVRRAVTAPVVRRAA